MYVHNNRKKNYVVISILRFKKPHNREKIKTTASQVEVQVL